MLGAVLSFALLVWALCAITCASFSSDPWDDPAPSWRFTVYVVAAAPVVLCALLALGLYRLALWAARRVKGALASTKPLI